jgi:hypothetical protein
MIHHGGGASKGEVWVTKKFSQIKTIKCPKSVRKKYNFFFVSMGMENIS